MGLFNSMFGGGTGLEVSLESGTVTAGEELAGTVIIRGGKKAARITRVVVKILGSRVGGAGDFEHRILFDDAIALDLALPAGESVEVPLSITLPDDADPEHDYQLTATADIPGVADPSAKVSFRVAGQEDAGHDSATTYSVDEVLGQWPALSGSDVEAFREAAVELYEAKENYDVSAGAEVLAGRFQDDDLELRQTATWWYARILGPTTDASAVAPLLELTSVDNVDFLQGLVSAAGALGLAGEPLLAELAHHPIPAVRRSVGFELPTVGGPRQRELAELLLQDSEADVATSGLKALGGKLLREPQVIAHLVSVATGSDLTKMRVHALYALQDAHEYDAHEAALPAFVANLGHEDTWARATVAETLPKWPESPRLMAMLEQLAADEDSHVRCKLAGTFHARCPEHLRPLWERLAAQDPAKDVRMLARQALED
ncbi:sporulation protein [Myxococcus stipitatus]|uniref:sporulation protein n=1 Tax=Myxococcus stipitatus TaxID=83455 RepID=UPI0030CD922F